MTINGVIGLEETGVLYATVNRDTALQRQSPLIHKRYKLHSQLHLHKSKQHVRVNSSFVPRPEDFLFGPGNEALVVHLTSHCMHDVPWVPNIL